MTAERYQAHPVDEELVVPIRLGDALPEPPAPDPFPLVAWWQRLDGVARAFVLAIGVIFASVAYLFGPGWAGLAVGIVVLVDAWGFSLERGRSDQ